MAQNGLVAQLRSIAASVEVLPEVLDALESMSGNVETMVGEVTRMREGVDLLSVEVKQLNTNVEPLDQRFVEMLNDMKDLEGHLNEVHNALAPLQRAFGGIGNLGGRLRGNREPAE